MVLQVAIARGLMLAVDCIDLSTNELWHRSVTEMNELLAWQIAVLLNVLIL
jgi:hypothetical protein